MDDTSTEASASSATSYETAVTSPSPSSPPTTPPSILTAHHKLLVDAITKKAVTEKTDLAALYDFSDGSIDNRLLRNLTHISEPAVRCALMTSNGTIYPPTQAKGKHGYDLYFSFNKLLFAPCVRLECRFPEHTAALEFHFNPCDEKQLFDFTWSQQCTCRQCELIKPLFQINHPAAEPEHQFVTFKTNGASCQGFNQVRLAEKTPSFDQKAICKTLRSLINPTEAEPLKFRLCVAELDASSKEELRKIQSLLPGGSESVLPSIGVPEYSCFPIGDVTGLTPIHKPFMQMQHNPPSPMVPLPASDTFASLTEFAAQHTISTVMQEWENQTTLLTFARGSHTVKIYEFYPFAVFAMDFGDIPDFGNITNTSRFRLPNELEVDMKININLNTLPYVYLHEDDDDRDELRSFRVYHETQPMGLPKHDAYFMVEDRSLSWFGGLADDPTTEDPESYKVLKFKPHQNSFLFKSQRETISRLQNLSFEPWKAIILNQLHDELEGNKDITTGLDIPPKVVADAKKWLLGCKPWNKLQLQVIEQMFVPKGGLSICSGIAGTGKTTLQVAFAIFCVKLRGRALLTGTANTNADLIVKAIHDFEGVLLEKKLRVYRLYAGSKKIPLDKMIAHQVVRPKAGHIGGNCNTWENLRFETITKKKKMGALDLSLGQGVLDEAEKGELKHKAVVKLHGTPAEKGGVELEVWSTLKTLMKNKERGYPVDSAKLHAVFDAAKAHLLSITDILVSTNGNARCREIEAWSMKDEDQKPKFFGVFADEVAKEQEINILNVVTADFPRKPDIYVFFGDERQLDPINTCAKSKFHFNPFNGRLDTSLFGRLIREGFPHVHLTTQQRMHPCLSKFPNKEFYDSTLQDYEGVQRTLEDVKPGLAPVLHGIIAKWAEGMNNPKNAQVYLDNATDEQARLHYIQILGGRETFNDRKSKIVEKYVDVFFDQIFPSLQDYFKDTMEDEVMLIVAYGMAIREYEQRVNSLQRSQRLPRPWYPRIYTIDSSQGQEATMSIVDGSMMWREFLGFMSDKGRSNVALTRAKEVCWILGGELELKSSKNAGVPLAPFVKLKLELTTTGQVHTLT